MLYAGTNLPIDPHYCTAKSGRWRFLLAPIWICALTGTWLAMERATSLLFHERSPPYNKFDEKSQLAEDFQPFPSPLGALLLFTTAWFSSTNFQHRPVESAAHCCTSRTTGMRQSKLNTRLVLKARRVDQHAHARSRSCSCLVWDRYEWRVLGVILTRQKMTDYQCLY